MDITTTMHILNTSVCLRAPECTLVFMCVLLPSFEYIITNLFGGTQETHQSHIYLLRMNNNNNIIIIMWTQKNKDFRIFPHTHIYMFVYIPSFNVLCTVNRNHAKPSRTPNVANE